MKKINFICMRHSYCYGLKLTQEGIEEAEKARDELNLSFDAVFYSSELRAMQTAWIVGRVGSLKHVTDLYYHGRYFYLSSLCADFAPYKYMVRLDPSGQEYAWLGSAYTSYEDCDNEWKERARRNRNRGIVAVRSYDLEERGNVKNFIEKGFKQNFFLPEWNNVLIVSHQPALNYMKEDMRPCEYFIYEHEF